MAARGYKFYLLMLKVFLPLLFTSLTRERYFQHLNIKFVSPRGHVISSFFLHTLQSFEIVRKLDCPDPEIQTRYVIKFTMVSET